MDQIQGKVNPKSYKIAVVTAEFNLEITEKLEKGCLLYLREMGISEKNILSTRVPGAFEIPLAASLFLEKGVDAVVTLGAVIRGETSHYDYVCSAVERGCTELQLKYQKPVGFGVLTTENEEQALDRSGGSYGNKGQEAAEVVLKMLDLKDQIADLKL